MHTKSKQILHHISKTNAFAQHCKRYESSSFGKPSLGLVGLPRASAQQKVDTVTEAEKQLLGLERDADIEIDRDPRTEPDFPEIRVKGPRSRNKDYKSKTPPTEHEQSTGNERVYNRAGIEKPHVEWGWSPFHSRDATQWNWKDNQRANDGISNNEKKNWPESLPKELMRANVGKNELRRPEERYYNPDDLTTFESYSETARSATFKAALNVGVHWGKEKRLWHTSMGPYLKGVIDGRHVFDLSLTIANLRKTIRLLQSLIMDECHILFVCNDVDHEMKTLARIMCTRCNMPLLDSRWTPGSLNNWNWMAENYRGPGRELTDGKRPNLRWWRRTKLHRMLQEPPHFIFLLNRKANDIVVHEANRVQIPVGSLCDSDDSTRDLQYVIPCNTQSIQAVHFVLDMITRGILEAQAKMDSAWWARQKDLEVDRDALYAAELEWQYKYDPYQQQRLSMRMAPTEDPSAVDIATNYVKDDEDVIADQQFTEVGGRSHMSNIVLNKFGGVQAFDNSGAEYKSEMGNYNVLDDAEQSRREKLKGVLDNQSSEHMRKMEVKQKQTQSEHEQYVRKFSLPNTFQSASDFSLKMLQDYTANQTKYRQRLAAMTGDKTGGDAGQGKIKRKQT